MTDSEQLRENLRWMAHAREQMIPWPKDDYAYSSMEDFVAKEGRTFNARRKPMRYQWGLEQACYANTFRLVDESEGALRYVEGYGCASALPIPILHAWAIDSHNRVVDVTWRHPKAYVGIVFDFADVEKATVERDGYVAMIDDWTRGWPLLRRKETA